MYIYVVAPLTAWATAMAGWMSSRLDAIQIAALALSVGLVGTFITRKSSMRWITSCLVWKKRNNNNNNSNLILLFLLFYYSFYFFCCTLQAVSIVFSTASLWFFARCCLNMSLICIPVLKPKTLPAVCADLVNPCMARNIPACFWGCDVFWDLREIKCYSCYHTTEQRLAWKFCKLFKILQFFILLLAIKHVQCNLTEMVLQD